MLRHGSFSALASACALASVLFATPRISSADAVPPPTAVDKKAAAAANARGSKALDKKKLDVAIKELEAATKLDPTLAIAWINLGWARFLTLHNDALDEADRDEANGLAAATDPNQRGAALYNMGRIAERKGDLAAAAVKYRESLKERPGNKVVAAAQFRAERYDAFVKALGLDPKAPGVNVVGPIAYAPKAGAKEFAAGVIVSEPPAAQTEEQYRCEYLVGVVDEAGKLVGKAALPPTVSDKTTEEGSGDGSVGTLALASGVTLLRVDKLEERTDLGSGHWPAGHYDYMTLFTVDGGKLKPAMTQAVRYQESVAPDDEVSAYKIAMKAAGDDLVFDEAEVMKKGAPKKQTVTYKWKNGAFVADKKSLVPSDAE